MKNKGEITTGIMISVFVGIIVALVLLTAISPYIGQTARTLTMTNVTFTPVNNSFVDLRGQELIGDPIVTNATVSVVVPASNYTIAEGVSSVDGLKRIRLYITDKSDAAQAWPKGNLNITYTYGMEGYADDAGARAIILLIMTFAVIAILVFTLYPVLKERFDF